MEEKPKIYLDTNIILGWFKNKMRSIRKDIKFILPKRMEAILQQKEYIPVISLLVKSEVFKYLKSVWNATEEEINMSWNEFILTFRITELEYKKFVVSLNNICEICKRIPLGKKTIVDIIHLQIAKDERIKFLTADKKLKERLGWYYPEIITLEEFLEHPFS